MYAIYDDFEILEENRHYVEDRNKWNEAGQLYDYTEEGEL